MNVNMLIRTLDGMVVEEYVVPDGTWVQTKALGMQHASPYLKPTLVSEEKTTAGTFRLILSPVGVPPKVPDRLLKLVNGNDPRWGRHGWEWMGIHRDSAGGTEVERVREFVRMYWTKGRDCPVKLTDEEVEILKDL